MRAKAVANALNPRVARCVIKALKALELPRPDYEKTLEYPFQFVPNK